MTGSFGLPSWTASTVCCPPNLLGGSRRTTVPGFIRPLTTHRQHDSRMLDGTTTYSSRDTTGTSVSDYDLLVQHPACKSSRGDAATWRIKTKKSSHETPDRYSFDRQSTATTGRCCMEPIKHDEGRFKRTVFLSGTDVTVRSASTSELKPNNNKESQSPPVDPTPSPRSHTLPTDIRDLQSFQILSSESANIVDVGRKRSRGVARFFSGVSIKSLHRLFVATADRRRERSAASLTDSSPSVLKSPAVSADCGAPSKESLLSSVATAAVQPPVRLRFGRFCRHDVPHYSVARDITTQTSVHGSTAPLSTVAGCDLTMDVASRAIDSRRSEVVGAPNQREQTVDTSGTVEDCGNGTNPEQHSETAGVLRLLQPPTTLDLPVPRCLTSSPAHRQVRRRCPMSSYKSVESIGQCSVDALASTDAGWYSTSLTKCTHNTYQADNGL